MLLSRFSTAASESRRSPARTPTPMPVRAATPLDACDDAPRIKPAWSKKKPIATPWPVRWTRSCRQVLPCLAFLIAVAIAALLLHRQTESVVVAGEVEARRAIVSSPVAGILTPVNPKIDRLDRVRQGDLIARVESESLLATPSEDERELAPLRSGLKTTHAAQIRAPLSGCVTEVYLHPGQFVQPGQPILEIVEEGGNCIVAYIRSDQHIRPWPGMQVQVHLRSDPGHVYESHVETVGVQMERLPDHLLRDHKTPEWGLPVRIAIPPAAALRPHEPVNVLFTPANASDQEPVRVPSTKTTPIPKKAPRLHLAMALSPRT